MQALIVKEIYDPEPIELLTYLHQHGFKTFFAESIYDVPATLARMRPDDPCVFYRNSFIRFAFPDGLAAELSRSSDVTYLTIAGTPYQRELVVFRPKDVLLYRENLTCKNNNPTFLTYNPPSMRTEAPKGIEPPRIFVPTNSHDVYLRLSLNSLFYSIDNTVPVTIFLNGATPEVVVVAEEFAKRYSQIELLYSSINVGYHCLRTFIQWYQPEKFIVWEDDFILPPGARDWYPHWPYQFAHRLKYFDLVGWRVRLDNLLAGRPRRYFPPYTADEFPEEPPGKWIYARRGEKYYTPLMGQALGMTLDFYNRCRKQPPWNTTIDVTLHESAESYCVPSLPGYHIGWNSEMDGIPRSKEVEVPSSVTLVSSSGVEKSIDLS